MARFQFLAGDRRLTDGQNRLLNPASRMRARGNNHGTLYLYSRLQLCLNTAYCVDYHGPVFCKYPVVSRKYAHGR